MIVLRRADYSSDELDVKGFELVIAIGPIGLQMFFGKRK